MAVRTAEAEWKGDLPSGTGTVKSESGALHASYSFASRFEEGTGTNPEELIGAAHAGCFSMALANILAQDGHDPRRIGTTARVHLEKGDEGPGITRIQLLCEAEVPGLDDASFQEYARKAREGCPVSRALAATKVELEAKLVG
ncbi:MAG TPA: OsmC family protein [Longimicrobiales bacterium]|nr:OsmC family protein [Longimicrobiales bacterium]